MKEAIAIALIVAPFQCGSSEPPRREETAGDALYALAEDFDAKGDHAAAQRTREYLVTHYPSSRHADAAKRKLDAGSE